MNGNSKQYGDPINKNPNASNTRLCPLTHYSCKQDPKSLEEHFRTEQHQKSLVKSAQKIIDKQKNNSKLDIFIKALKAHLDKYYVNILTLLQTIEIVRDEILDLNIGILRFKHGLLTLSEEVNEMTKQYILQNSHINGQLLNLNLLSYDITAVKQQILYESHLKPYHTPHGVMLWRINNVREKMYDAESEHQISIFSPAFYTSATGYKLCVRLYLNGDGTARGTHLSIFLVILRSPFDPLLKWPFSYRVSFCLVDQRSIMGSDSAHQTAHIIDSFRPNVQSVSFERPRSAMNIASGIPKFFPLVGLKQAPETNRYVINDTMFIKVWIDFIGIPKSMMSFIFNLNCGLPVQVQQKLIDEEMKHRQQLQST